MYDLLKTRSARRFSFPETAAAVCVLLLLAGLAYFAYFNFRYWYTLHPPLVIGLWFLLGDRKVCNSVRLLGLAVLQILITMCICGALLLLPRRDSAPPSPQNVNVGKTEFAPDPENPFSIIPEGSREVLVVAKNPRLLRKAAFPVYYFGRNRQVLYLLRFTHAEACDSPDDFLPLLRKHNISFVIVEKNNLHQAHNAAVAELRKNFRILFESKNYCIWSLDQKTDRRAL